jgi:hypothetical protein
VNQVTKSRIHKLLSHYLENTRQNIYIFFKEKRVGGAVNLYASEPVMPVLYVMKLSRRHYRLRKHYLFFAKPNQQSVLCCQMVIAVLYDFCHVNFIFRGSVVFTAYKATVFQRSNMFVSHLINCFQDAYLLTWVIC